MEITSIKDGAGEEHLNDPVYALGDGVKVYDLRDTVNVESFGFDPTSDIYQEHYNDLYSLGLDLDGYGSDDDARDEAFIQAMWAWITEKDEDRQPRQRLPGWRHRLHRGQHRPRGRAKSSSPSGEGYQLHHAL